jgi:hypothetical protein
MDFVAEPLPDGLATFFILYVETTFSYNDHRYFPDHSYSNTTH